jgi:hypothetical protein
VRRSLSEKGPPAGKTSPAGTLEGAGKVARDAGKGLMKIL